MKSNGIQKNGVYTISMNMHAIVTNQKINFINKKYGGNLKINLVYDPNDTTSNVIDFNNG